MHAIRRRTALAVVLLAGAFPAGALAQTPGDEQYQDPFGGSQSGGDQGGSSQEPTAPAPTSTPAPAAPAAPSRAAPATGAAPEVTPAQATPAQAAPAVQQLPYTGAGTRAALLAAAGTLLIAGGITLRVRLRERG